MPEWLFRRSRLTPEAPALFFRGRMWTFAELDAAATAAARRLGAVLDFGSEPVRDEKGYGAVETRFGDDTDGGSHGNGADGGSQGNGIGGDWPGNGGNGGTGMENRVGPRVAVLFSNTDTFVVLVHAIAKAGAVLVPLNTRLTPAEMAWQVADAGAQVLIHDAAFADTAAAVFRAVAEPGGAEGLRLLDAMDICDIQGPRDTRDIQDAQDTRGPRDAHDTRDTRGPRDGHDTRDTRGPRDGHDTRDTRDTWYVHDTRDTHDARDTVGGRGVRTRIRLGEVHSIVYTSGTTGKPKGAMLTFGNHWWSAVGSVLNLGLVPGDRWLACMPLFHAGGLSILMRSVIYGIPVILHEKFDAAAVNRAIDEEGASLLSVVAAMLERMLDERGDVPYPPSLRAVLLGGGPAPEALLRRAAKMRMPVLQTYGLTETASQAATLAPEDALRKQGSAGKPLFPTELRIVVHEDGGRAREAAPGEAGEITVSGPSVTPGYWGRPDDTAQKLRDGWLFTGDVGCVDAEGYLYVLDRRDDMFVSGGENVYPAEVEAALREHEAVAEAGVVGLPDEHWGRVPAAAVVLRAGADVSADDLREFCRSRLAGYKVPKRFAFVDALPRTATGKLLRRELFRMF